MVCKNCRSKKAIAKKKIVIIEGIRNKVLASYCLICGNLVHGYCRVIK